MAFLEFPTHEEWTRIYRQNPYIHFYEQLQQLETSLSHRKKSQLGHGLHDFILDIELSELILQLGHRLSDITKSLVLLHYYFDKGIPDDEWYISPGKDGVSIQYYPHFEQKDFQTKDWFDFYSDTFYQKLFSAWDILGHILNKVYRLNIKPKSIDFPNAIKNLSSANSNLGNKLDNIANTSEYQRAKELRNNSTHNYLPHSVGLTVKTTSNEHATNTSIGIRHYTTSKEIMSNVQHTSALLRETISAIVIG